MREKLELIRQTILEAVPEGKEITSYHMPAIKTIEVLVYYAAAKNHLGFYLAKSGVTEFKKELGGYQTSKGAIQIPYTQPVPVKLIADITKFRFFEEEEKKESKG